MPGRMVIKAPLSPTRWLPQLAYPARLPQPAPPGVDPGPAFGGRSAAKQLQGLGARVQGGIWQAGFGRAFRAGKALAPDTSQ